MDFFTSINYLLNQVFIAYRSNLEKSLNEIGLHSGQVFILIDLWNEDGRIQNQIAKSLNLSAPTINKMIKSLAQNGFLQMTKSDFDGRASIITLTEKGLEIRGQVEQIWQDLETDIYSNLTPTEKMIFNQLLEKIRDNLLT
jgi:DNA-binding MarR family transcriptional regulator